MSFYLSNQRGKVSMEGWLSTCEANSVDPISQRMKTTENIFQWNGGILPRMENKGMIVAIRTAKITVRKKKHGTEFFWPIQKRGL
jgi:hypothetical protein